MGELLVCEFAPCKAYADKLREKKIKVGGRPPEGELHGSCKCPQWREGPCSTVALTSL